MAFDGTTIAAVRKELSDSILGGRIYKIAQPEPDELLITIKTPEGQRKLYISASASLPLIYLTDENKPSPMTAPGFCMLLQQICWEWAYHSYLTAVWNVFYSLILSI